jgi:hypothetical protein
MSNSRKKRRFNFYVKKVMSEEGEQWCKLYNAPCMNIWCSAWCEPRMGRCPNKLKQKPQ